MGSCVWGAHVGMHVEARVPSFYEGPGLHAGMASTLLGAISPVQRSQPTTHMTWTWDCLDLVGTESLVHWSTRPCDECAQALNSQPTSAPANCSIKICWVTYRGHCLVLTVKIINPVKRGQPQKMRPILQSDVSLCCGKKKIWPFSWS